MVAEDDPLPDMDEALGFYMRYEANEVLGHGVSSVVRRCVSKETGRNYAVKIIDISQEHVNADGLDMVEQVHQEINILRLVGDHPNIIELIEYFESQTYVFLVFELCPNGELFDYLSQNVRLSEKRCRNIMRQIFLAVRHCHQHGIVHRDLKPENILLDADFNIKLTDFGFARKLEPKERLYETVGTPGYLAPEVLTAGMFEQDQCDGYGFEVDAWACGVILYTLLIGRPPFWHRKQIILIRLIMKGEYSMEGPEWSEITAETRDLISSLLVVDHHKRLTISGALNHEVFRAQRYFRSGSPIHSDMDENYPSLWMDDPTTSSSSPMQQQQQQQEEPSLQSEDETDSKQQLRRLSIPAIQVQQPRVFDARQTFKVTILCIRFLIRLLNLKKTPELLSLRLTQLNPYCMRSYRKAIDISAYNLYSHWVKKGEGQNRAAIFQHFVKRDHRRKPPHRLVMPKKRACSPNFSRNF